MIDRGQALDRLLRTAQPHLVKRKWRMKTEITRDDTNSDHQLHVSPKGRNEMIAVAAYFRAENRGFAPGEELQDWLTAASIIDHMLDTMRKKRVTRGDYERAGLRNALRMWVD